MIQFIKDAVTLRKIKIHGIKIYPTIIDGKDGWCAGIIGRTEPYPNRQFCGHDLNSMVDECLKK